MASKPPKHYQKFADTYRDIAKAYEELGAATQAAGPLDKKTRALIKVAISIATHQEGGAHSHVRKAIDAGATKEELYHVALLAIPTVGFPTAMAGLSFIDDVLQEKTPKHKNK
ncbi:MAG: carboxymuconolactone decarboxylase family protein [bacterium]